MLKKKELFDVSAGKNKFYFEYNGTECTSILSKLPKEATYEFDDKTVYYIYVGKQGTFSAPASHKKPTYGTGEFSLRYVFSLY